MFDVCVTLLYRRPNYKNQPVLTSNIQSPRVESFFKPITGALILQ